MADSKKSAKGKTSAPRKISGGKKTNSNVSASPWKSIDPVVPIIAVDFEPPKGNDTARYDGYGNKVRKSKKVTKQF